MNKTYGRNFKTCKISFYQVDATEIDGNDFTNEDVVFELDMDPDGVDVCQNQNIYFSFQLEADSEPMTLHRFACKHCRECF
jgi:hypothetical protein